MPRAVWDGREVAVSDDTIVVGGYHYFPEGAVDRSVLRNSRTKSFCPWRGVCSYYTLEAGAVRTPDAAFYYPHPLPPARRIKHRIAFWKDVTIEP